MEFSRGRKKGHFNLVPKFESTLGQTVHNFIEFSAVFRRFENVFQNRGINNFY